MLNDQLILNINKRLREFSHAPSNPSIHRVTDCLRSTTSKAFDPMIISIGPFHHGKSNLKEMQKLKMSYLKQVVGDSNVDKYVRALRSKEQAARDCYAEEIPLESDEFVELLLLDGIFVIQFLRQADKVRKGEEESFDSHVPGSGNVVSLLQDLLLLENQIPLLVIDLLLDVLKNHNNHGEQKLCDLIGPYLLTVHLPKDMPLDMNADHLLGLVHSAMTLSFSKTLSSKEGIDVEMENIQSASELKDAGVVFKKAKSDNWLDITFKNKTIHFPELEISDFTESLLKNMIAYEDYRPFSEQRYVTDYVFFLQCLVHSSKDAELLRRCGIISNWLGGDARVYELIDRLGAHAQPSKEFSYLCVFRSVNDHCRHRRNRWFAVLRRNHLNNPWTVISLVAAVLLLSAGILQMVFAVLSYYRDSLSSPQIPFNSHL